MLKDVGFALRLLVKNKAFTLAATLTLAIGIGGTTVMFTIVDAVVIRPLPFPGPDRLVWGWGRFPQSDSASISPPDFMDYRAQAKSLGVAAMTSFSRPTEVSGNGEPEVLAVRSVSAGFFETLGAAPVLGRSFVRADEQEERPLVAAISHGHWQRRFGSDPAVVGRTLVLDGNPVTVVAVIGRIRLSWRCQDSTTAVRSSAMRARRSTSSGLSDACATGQPPSAQAELDAIAARARPRVPCVQPGVECPARLAPRGAGRPGADAGARVLRGRARVLLIACVNVVNLLLARAASRAGEMALRAALGAGRTRILRQLLAEGVVLALLGGLAGVAVAHAGVQAVRDLRLRGRRATLVGLHRHARPRLRDRGVPGNGPACSGWRRHAPRRGSTCAVRWETGWPADRRDASGLRSSSPKSGSRRRCWSGRACCRAASSSCSAWIRGSTRGRCWARSSSCRRAPTTTGVGCSRPASSKRCGRSPASRMLR